MGLFRKRAGGDSRTFRLLKQRCREAGTHLAVLLLVCGAGALLWKSGSAERISAAVLQRAVGVSATVGFRVGDILVAGRNRIAREEILARLGVAKGTPIFSVDLAAARESFLALPWVKDAQIARRLPDTLVVSVSERAPFALWQMNRKVSVVDAEGVVLPGAALKAFSSLPMIVGEGAPQAAAALFETLNAEPAVAAQVASAVRIGARRWDLHLKNGMVVLLPAGDEGLALARLARAQARTALFAKSVSRVDLRLPGRLVLTPGLAVKKNRENI